MVSGGKGIRAGKAYVEIGSDDSKYVAGLKKAANRLRAWGTEVSDIGRGIAKIGAVALAPLLGAAKVFSSYGDSVAKMAKRTGLSTETLSELRFVASQTGTEFEGLETAFKKMQRTIYDAGRGLTTATDALSDLGLTLADVQGLSPEEQFKLLAQRMSMVDDETRKVGIALSIFGRAGTNLIPMFNEGAKGIEELQQRARELGLTMSSEDAKAAEEFTDDLDELAKVAKQGAFTLGAALAPSLTKITNALVGGLQVMTAWIKKSRETTNMMLQMGAGTVGFGLALMGLGGIAKFTAGLIKAVFSHPVILGIGAASAATLFLAHAFRRLSEDVGKVRVEMEAIRFQAPTMELRAVEKQLEALRVRYRDMSNTVRDIAHGWLFTSERLVAQERTFTNIGEVGKTILALEQRRHDLLAKEKTLLGERADAEWIRKVGQIQLEQIENEHDKRIALLNEQYDHELQLAQEAGATKLTLDEINLARRLELMAVENARAKALLAEQQKIAMADQTRGETIAELELRAKFKGLQLERELLKLKEAQAIAAAKAAGENIALVQREYELRRQLLEQGEELSGTLQMRNVGVFNPAAIRGLEPSNIAQRTASAAEKTAENTKRLLQLVESRQLTFA